MARCFRASELRQETTYTVRDDDTTPRVVLLEHPLRPGWTLAERWPEAGGDGLRCLSFRRQREPPKSTATLNVIGGEATRNQFRRDEYQRRSDQALRASKNPLLPRSQAAFRKILEQKNRVDDLNTQISDRDDEKQAIYDDQQRLRENLKALTGGAEERALMQRYTQQLADQETRLDALKKESADLQSKQDEAQAELNKMIEELSLDATL